jgi:hypothetical protein
MGLRGRKLVVIVMKRKEKVVVAKFYYGANHVSCQPLTPLACWPPPFLGEGSSHGNPLQHFGGCKVLSFKFGLYTQMTRFPPPTLGEAFS